MAQLSTGWPFLFSIGVHFCSPSNQVTSLPNSGHDNKNDAMKGQLPRCPTPFQSHPSQGTKKLLPILGSPLNTGYSHMCLLPSPFLKVTQVNDPCPRGEEYGQAVSPSGSPHLTP